jgi:hypothetical protein
MNKYTHIKHTHIHTLNTHTRIHTLNTHTLHCFLNLTRTHCPYETLCFRDGEIPSITRILQVDDYFPPGFKPPPELKPLTAKEILTAASEEALKQRMLQRSETPPPEQPSQ